MAEQTPTQGRPVIPGAPTSANAAKNIVRSRLVMKQSGVVDAAGLITMMFGPVPSSKDWEVERISINCTAGVLVDFSLYEDDVTTLNRKDFTPSGNDNTADYNPVLWFGPGRVLIAEWSGVPALDPFGNPCVAYINMQLSEVG